MRRKAIRSLLIASHQPESIGVPAEGTGNQVVGSPIGISTSPGETHAAGLAVAKLTIVLALVTAPTVVAAQVTAVGKPVETGIARQDAPKPGAERGVTVDGVTVTASPTAPQTQIDRRSYSLTNDLQAVTGSIGQALANVPSVEVDLQGNVSLRGGSVTILVDGKPAGAFDDASRANTMQQLPATQFERVEVMTNPSAAFTAEGSGGIINLITKPARGPGPSASVYGISGGAGLKRVGGTSGYNSAKLSVSASASANYQPTKVRSTEIRDVRSPNGDPISEVSRRGTGSMLNRGSSAQVSVGYSATPTLQLSSSLQYSEALTRGEISNGVDIFERGTTSSLDQIGRKAIDTNNLTLSVGARQRLPGEGHELTADLVRNRTRIEDVGEWKTLASTFVATPFELIQSRTPSDRTDLKLSYSRPMPGDAKLKVGSDSRWDNNTYDSLVARGPTAGGAVIEFNFSNLLKIEQDISAAYVTYERPFGRVTVLGGLRYEGTDLDLRQETIGRRDSIRYAGLYPSLNAEYRPNDSDRFSLAYGERLSRAPAVALNPFRSYVDTKLLIQGNPNLKPMETKSWELSYQRRQGGKNIQLTLFNRTIDGDFSTVISELADGTALLTFANYSGSKTTGVEGVASGKLSAQVTYNANLSVAYNKIELGNLNRGDQDRMIVSGRGSIDWQATSRDLLQVNALRRGERLLAQGYSEAVWILNLGWRRTINDRASLVLTAQDVLNRNRYSKIYNAPGLRGGSLTEGVTRAVVLRLDYRFGGGPKRNPDLIYDNAPPA